jgi:hypothetical protein
MKEDSSVSRSVTVSHGIETSINGEGKKEGANNEFFNAGAT